MRLAYATFPAPTHAGHNSPNPVSLHVRHLVGTFAGRCTAPGDRERGCASNAAANQGDQFLCELRPQATSGRSFLLRMWQAYSTIGSDNTSPTENRHTSAWHLC